MMAPPVSWEGDFRVANGTIPILAGGGDLHNFGGGVFSNRVESSSTFVLRALLVGSVSASRPTTTTSTS